MGWWRGEIGALLFFFTVVVVVVDVLFAFCSLVLWFFRAFITSGGVPAACLRIYYE